MDEIKKCRLEENRIIEIQDRFRNKIRCVEDWILPCIKAQKLKKDNRKELKNEKEKT